MRTSEELIERFHQGTRDSRIRKAAPELLAALKGMLEFNRLHTVDQILAIKAAKAAIAKAEE